ncbi:MAG: hypothetical protein RBR41_00260 [Desulfovibrio sp.]|uniref:hypothetical protein n=1 Tax=Desulfovibrio sp. TaxID=885 RepID=UPI002A36B3BB|nr:hypothetical protein [Desulfovibrio sp.]MDY0258089.1 hypothetical protein [Desulfovibrio sp.]
MTMVRPQGVYLRPKGVYRRPSEFTPAASPRPRTIELVASTGTVAGETSAHPRRAINVELAALRQHSPRASVGFPV